MKYTIIFVASLLMLSCSDRDKIFSVKSESDFLSQVQSVTAPDLSRDSLKFYLTPFELRTLDTSTTIKNIRKLFGKSSAKGYLLLRSHNGDSRSHEFLVRTYTNDWTLIDTYQVGIWDEKVKYFCYGSVGKDLTIEKKCDDDQTADKLKIQDDGKIVRRHEGDLPASTSN